MLRVTTRVEQALAVGSQGIAQVTESMAAYSPVLGFPDVTALLRKERASAAKLLQFLQCQKV